MWARRHPQKTPTTIMCPHTTYYTYHYVCPHTAISYYYMCVLILLYHTTIHVYVDAQTGSDDEHNRTLDSARGNRAHEEKGAKGGGGAAPPSLLELILARLGIGDRRGKRHARWCPQFTCFTSDLLVLLLLQKHKY